MAITTTSLDASVARIKVKAHTRGLLRATDDYLWLYRRAGAPCAYVRRRLIPCRRALFQRRCV